MSSSQQPSDRSKLDEYLDGTMPAQEREEFAREIAANPQLQAEIELQNRINQSLSQHYLPPVAPTNLGQILKDSAPRETSSATGKTGTSVGAIVGATAAVAIIWGGLFWYFFKPAPRPPEPPPRVIELVTPYREAMSTGFQPTSPLTNSKDFTKIVSDYFGRGLRIKSLPPGHKVLGLTRSDLCGCSGCPVSIYAHIDGKPVMVFVQLAANDIRPEQPTTESKLKLFRKEMGPLVLYELTPFDKAKATDLFELGEDTPPKQ